MPMAKKSDLKQQIKKYKKRLTRIQKIVEIGLRSITERDTKIAQLTSVLVSENRSGEIQQLPKHRSSS
jgi:hypothetical protein